MSIQIHRTTLTENQLEYVKNAVVLMIGKQTEHGLMTDVFYDPVLKKKSDDIRMDLMKLYIVFIDTQRFHTDYYELGKAPIPKQMVNWFGRLLSTKDIKLVIEAIELAVIRCKELDRPEDKESVMPLKELIGMFSMSVELEEASCPA